MRLDELDCAAKLDRAEFWCEFEASKRRATPTCLRAAAVGYIYRKVGRQGRRCGGWARRADQLSDERMAALITELIGFVPADVLMRQPDALPLSKLIAAAFRPTMED